MIVGFPRPRGDEPRDTLSDVAGNHVFPARAGMSPSSPPCNPHGPRFPRPRGDEPAYADTAASTVGFSPPARG